MQAKLAAHDLGFDDIADDRDHDIYREQRQRELELALYRRDGCPWDHDAACTEHGQDVKDRNQQRNHHRVFDPDDRQADGQLYKCDRHDERIRTDADEQRTCDIGLDLPKHLLRLFAHLTDKETGDAVVVHSDKKRGNNHEQELDEQPGQGTRQAVQHADRSGGQAGHQLAERFHELPPELFKGSDQGFVNTQDGLLNSAENAHEHRLHPRGVKAGQPTQEVSGSGKRLDPQQRQQQPNGAVKYQHQRDRRRFPADMQLMRGKADRPLKQVGKHEADHERREQRQRVFEQHDREQQHDAELQGIDDKRSFFIQIHGNTPSRAQGRQQKKACPAAPSSKGTGMPCLLLIGVVYCSSAGLSAVSFLVYAVPFAAFFLIIAAASLPVNRRRTILTAS